MTRKLSLLLVFLCSTITATPDKYIHHLIQDSLLSSAKTNNKKLIHAIHYRTVTIDINQLKNELEGVAQLNGQTQGLDIIIDLPWPDGSMHQYRVLENNTMNPELAAQFPEIKSYDGYSVDDANELVKFDLSPQGFHAMILSPGKSPIFIDPYSAGNTEDYMVYNKKNFTTNKTMKCSVSQSPLSFNSLAQATSFSNFSSCHLRKYRLALAATAQYTAFFGGTKQKALAAQVTTINRINGIYETEIGVTLEIIRNNTKIIYTNPLTQPYTSGDAYTLIQENQTNINKVIGSANYDIGHVFDKNTSTSGLAGLGVVCDSLSKASGVTGSNSPIGDPFDVDYVAHEIGHQFHGNHTQNNDCNRNDNTDVEPGSGSTIMGYAGVCAPNVQAHSDAYFHGINLQEIGNFLTNGAGNICAVQTPIPNAPTVANIANITIPASTPFTLTAFATGAHSAQFTYGWEQMDTAASPQPPEATSIDGPNFRSIPPTMSRVRVFPKLTTLANNSSSTWEVLSAVSRTMNFRVSVRNNTTGGSCNSYKDMTVTVNDLAGPFVLTYPMAPNIQWKEQTQKTITWNVANSNLAPINATKVDLLLSIDGGLSYPVVIAQYITNNGAYSIRVPSINTAKARIMVQSSNRTFFNISAKNIGITAPSVPVLTTAVRNPLNKNSAFIYYNHLGTATTNNRFTINNLPKAVVTLDRARSRFIVNSINSPKRITNVSITIDRKDNSIAFTNPVTIPGIL